MDIVEFYKYLEGKGLSTEQINLINEEDKTMLRGLYAKYEKCVEIEKNTWEAYQRSTSGIDYSTDILKSADNKMDAQAFLDEQIELMKECYGFSSKSL